jgi:phosphoribosylamine---glycine ligase
MKVLIVGSGGREHAIAYKLKESNNSVEIFILPGNAGTSSIGTNISLDFTDHPVVGKFCAENKIDLIIIGPEQPLVDGLADYLRGKGLNVFGPNKNAAEIEANKSFAKRIMKKAGVPTGAFVGFPAKMHEAVKEYLQNKKYPCVIKANGLAAGKGVAICQTYDEAEKYLEDLFGKKIFGEAGEYVLVEEFLEGEEASVFAISDGKDFICLPASQDHKRIGENDTGKNTGGMGAYAPAPLISPKLMEEIKNRIIGPTLRTLRDEGREFIGCLYAGVIVTKDGVKVIEFNCRFGDPETQVVLPILKGDFLELLHSAASGNLNRDAVEYNEACAVCVVTSAKGYPDDYEKGFTIEGLDKLYPDVTVFHAGTKMDNNKVVTNGGRVLGVTAIGKNNDLAKAKNSVYAALKNINFQNMYYRTDIADKALKKDKPE